MSLKNEYIKAAKRLANEEKTGWYKQSVDYCCEALETQGISINKFLTIFHEKSVNSRNPYCNFGIASLKENRLARSLALLFMAEMEK